MDKNWTEFGQKLRTEIKLRSNQEIAENRLSIDLECKLYRCTESKSDRIRKSWKLRHWKQKWQNKEMEKLRKCRNAKKVSRSTKAKERWSFFTKFLINDLESIYTGVLHEAFNWGIFYHSSLHWWVQFKSLFTQPRLHFNAWDLLRSLSQSREVDK